MAESNLNLIKYNGFGCLLSSMGTSLTIANDGAAATALPVYATGEPLEILSSSANDTAAGTGARTVQIIYIDTDGSIDSETVTLNGITGVNLTDTAVARVLDIHCLTFGSGGTNAGTITVQVDPGGATRMTIPVGHNRAAPGRFTVPTGYVGLYRGFNVSCGSTGTPTKVVILVEADINPLTGSLNENVYQPIDWGSSGAASGVIGNPSPQERGGRRVYLPSKTTIRMRVSADAGTATFAGFVFVELHPAPTI